MWYTPVLTFCTSSCPVEPAAAAEEPEDELDDEDVEDELPVAVGATTSVTTSTSSRCPWPSKLEAAAHAPERVESGTNLEEAMSANMAWSRRKGTDNSSRE